MQKKFLEEQLPKSLAALENLLKENKGGDAFFVGDAVRSYHCSTLMTMMLTTMTTMMMIN